MRNIIGELIEIENSANALIREADEYAAGLYQRIAEAKRSIKADIEALDALNANKTEALIVQETSGKLASIEQERERRLSDIKQLFNETHEMVEEAVFLRIIGKDAGAALMNIFTG